MLNRSILVANSDDCDPHAGREACQACALCTQEGIMQACRCCWSCNALYCRQVHSMVPSLFNQLCPCVGTYRSVFLHLNAAQRKWWPILIYSMYCSLNCKARTNFLANSTQRQQLGFSAKNMCIVHQNSSVHDGRELIIWHCTFQCMARSNAWHTIALLNALQSTPIIWQYIANCISMNQIRQQWHIAEFTNFGLFGIKQF